MSVIQFTLPGKKSADWNACVALRGLLSVSVDVVKTSSLVSCSQARESRDLFPQTSFFWRSDSIGVTVGLNFPTASMELPASFLGNRKRRGDVLPFVEAARRLTGSIARIDHTGLIAPSDIPQEDWRRVTNFLARHSTFMDYPHLQDGYDPAKARWLFVIPETNKEANEHGITDTTRRRQPKFELVWEADVHEPVLQIDMETRLTKDEIIKLFPGDESFCIPGLEEAFRSVPVRFPWTGMPNGRLDLRYKDDGKVNDWNSAKWLLDNGCDIFPNGPATRLPTLAVA